MNDMIAFREESDAAVLTLKGRIDAGNAPQFEAQIAEVLNGNTGSLIMDLQELEYISSAGLRVLLHLRHSHEDMKLTNVSADIYEILDMTGFTEIIPVEKAYRRFSVDGCKVIGRGANGKVYRYDPETVVKVYFNADALNDIKRERDLARKAFVMGLPTAIPYDVVRVGDSYGSVFELLNARSFCSLIAESPEKIDDYIGMFVDLLKKIHSTVAAPGDLPDMKQTAIGWINDLQGQLPDESISRLLDLLQAVPDSCNVLHGDYHTKNVMMQNGEVMLIDMDTLSCGNPVFEFGSIYNAYIGFGVIDPQSITNFLDMSIETAAYIWHQTLERYFGTTDPEILSRMENKAKLLGTVRLLRRTLRRDAESENGRKLIDHCKQVIADLLPQTDSLAF